MQEGAERTEKPGMDFWMAAVSSCGLKLMACMLYVRCVRRHDSASRNLTMPARQSDSSIIGSVASGRR